MFIIKKIIVIGFALSFLAAEPIELSSGFYQSTNNKDSIVVDVSSDRVEIELLQRFKIKV